MKRRPRRGGRTAGKKKIARKKPAAPARRAKPRRPRAADLDALRVEVEKRARALSNPRWNADPKDMERSVARLVLTLVEFVRRLLERQAVRRMEARTLTAEQVEAMGLALMRLEQTVRAMARRFGLDPEDLNLDLGPLGPLH
jgi:hypothetical protein